MKRIAILMVALASMGAGCWSDDTARVPVPAAPVPAAQQPAVPEVKLPDAVPPVPATGTVEQVPPVATQPVAPKPDEPTYVTVKMSQDGFNPAQITIKKGTIVRFTNVGEGDMWPASNPHPAHTTYQDFDARRKVKPGETYEFKFKNVGKWGCHDHLSPGLTCRIVIEE